MSSMSLAAIVVYAVVLVPCLLAARTARNFPDRPGDFVHWLAAGSVFAGLAFLRIVSAEDKVRDMVRSYTVNLGEYADRTSFQVPAVVAILLLGFLFVLWFANRWRLLRPGSRARLVLAARFALFCYLPLYALRLTSLHQFDQLLYRGPLPLNWVLEGGICALVAVTALLYSRIKRERFVRTPKKRRKSSAKN